MDFNAFADLVPKILIQKLPGEAAHQKMAPPERMEIMKNLDFELLNPRKAAVLMLFYPKEGKAHLVLIIRNSYRGVHSSQIAFPGGKVEHFDASEAETALRETHEEIGVPFEQITMIRSFSEVYIPPSNFRVYPFMGYSKSTLIFNPDPREVAGIIELPVADFLEEGNVVIKNIATSYVESADVPIFKFGENVVWGATAMMMSELKEVLKSALSS